MGEERFAMVTIDLKSISHAKVFPDPISASFQLLPIMVYTLYMTFFANNHNYRRCTMKVSQAVDFHLQYHWVNSKKYHQNL